MTHALPAARFVCGQPITRVAGQLKVTGKAPYAADNQIPGLVYAALVCSTVAITIFIRLVRCQVDCQSPFIAARLGVVQ